MKASIIRNNFFEIDTSANFRVADTAEIAGTLNGFCLVPCRIQSRQEHPRQNRDDRYDDEELYEGKNFHFYPRRKNI